MKAKKPSKKVYSKQTFESAALDVLESKSEPVSASQINKDIVSNYKVSQMRTSPQKVAKLLKRNPNIRVIYRRKGCLYELF